MRRLTSILVAAATLALAGCGSSGGGAKDAGTAGHDGAAGGGSDAKAGTSGGAGTTGAAGTPGSSIKKLVSGLSVALVGSGADSCTSLPGATTDRWCGLLKAGPADEIELWVIDVTMLGAGATVACDGTSPGCVRLSQTAFFDQNFAAEIHHFYGDTLIYYADAPATATTFSGTIWAWKPGWPAGRKLTSTIGNDCTASVKGDAIACIQGSAQIVAGELSVELLAGHPPATADSGLASLERIVIAAMGDAPNVQKWQVGFSSDGAYVGWSARDKATSPETLKVQKIGDAASRKTVATDVSNWQITQDGKSWLWQRAFNYSASAPSGTLETAPFPAGTPTAALGAGVATYQAGSDGSVLFQTAAGGELRRMPNPTTPAATQLLDSNILGVLESSDDGKTVVYVKNVDQTGLFDIWARDVAATAPCAVAGPSQGVTASLFAKNSTVLWARLDPLTGNLQGTATNIGTCKVTQFADNVLRWIPAGDDAITILDDTLQTADDSTLRYSRMVNDALPAQGAILQNHVTAIYAPAVPGAPVILYTTVTPANAAGLFAYIGPPLVATTPPAGDAGTTEAGTDAAGTDAGTVDASDAGPAASDASDAGAGGDADTGG